MSVTKRTYTTRRSAIVGALVTELKKINQKTVIKCNKSCKKNSNQKTN